MIGDDFRQDVHGAIELGMRGVLVRTGKYRSGDEAKISTCFGIFATGFCAVSDLLLYKRTIKSLLLMYSDPPPSHVATGFPNAVEWVLQRNSPGN